MEYLWILGLVLIIGAAVLFVIKERKNIKHWLLFAVAAAEKALGSGTGELKLHQVYDAFLTKFPVVGKFISFSTFKKLVDEALDSLEELIQNNGNINTYVKGE